LTEDGKDWLDAPKPTINEIQKKKIDKAKKFGKIIDNILKEQFVEFSNRSD
jgi:hypothetical protein